MNTTLLEILQKSNVPRTINELLQKTGLSETELRSTLASLQTEGAVAVTRKGKYAVPENIGLTTARISFQRNGAPLAHPLIGGTGTPLRIKGGLRCMPGDLVFVRMEDGYCELDSIIKRGISDFAAYVRLEKKLPKGKNRWQTEPRIIAYAVPCDLRIPYDVVLKGDLSFVRNNEIALLKIETWPEQNRPIYASVLRVLGNAGSLNTLMKAVSEDHNFHTELSENVEMDVKCFHDEIHPEDMADRVDLRDLLTFTIDGSTAKDFDDAVSLEKTVSGWKLGVHIADVSHYVQPGTTVDCDAYERGTSLYLPGYTVPMLPERLSNHLCSLMPDADRLALSLFMIIENGKIIDHHLVKSVIHSHARLTYQAVNRMFNGCETSISPEIQEILLNMRDLSHVLRNRRHAKGCIDFEIDEPEFVLNEKGEPVDILCEPRGESERIIEDFMLAANETVAALAMNTDLPFIYRIHETPDPDRLHTLETFLTNMNLPVHMGNTPHPGVLQDILKKAQAHPGQDVIRRYMLRALKKAQYSEKPSGHYALAMKDYCHFTSPIRRYPDLIVHRMLKALIENNLGQAEKMRDRMHEIAVFASARENAAVHAERQADDIMKASYMSRQIGRKYDGVISGITAWGVYVTLPNQVEGLVHIASLDDYFEYDRNREQLVGSYTGVILRMGDKVRIRMESADIQRGEINFELIALKGDRQI